MVDMITPEWVQMMARYNAWQNGWVVETASGLTDEARKLDRGAFFGSIAGTLSHILWADTLWMSRFDGGAAPDAPIAGGTQNYADWDAFRVLRSEVDGRIEHWANAMAPDGCSGDITWWSGTKNADLTQPKSVLFTHIFNHQTHHRGQVHGMLTSAGAATSDTDLIFME